MEYTIAQSGAAVSTVWSGQSGVYSGIAGGHREIVLRPHGRKGFYTCQAGIYTEYV